MSTTYPNNKSLFSVNSTVAPSPAQLQVWSVIPVFSLIILIVATLANGLVLYLFVCHRHLRTAFNIYVVNLVFCNLLETLIQLPLYLINNFRSHWWLGSTACSIYLYGQTVQAVMVCSHALITINRVWAVAAPVSFRARHTKTSAILLTLAVWIYVHIFRFPYFILDALYHRRPVEIFGCFVNKAAQLDLSIAQQFAAYTIPLAIIVLAYPYIAIKSFRTRSTIPHKPPVPVKMENLEVGAVSRKANERNTRAVTVDTSKKLTKKRTTGFLLLTLLTVSMAAAWIPTIVLYTVLHFRQLNWPTFVKVATILCLLETVLDPVFFMLALTDIRIALMKTFSKENKSA